MKIIGADVGKDLTVAVVVTIEDYQAFSPSEFYLKADFVECTPDYRGLEKFLALDGDIYIMEPTGRYSRVWADNLALKGNESRFVAHDKLSAYRENCGWSDKDDYHDAVALAWYGWERMNRPNAFNRIRLPFIQEMMEEFLRNKRLADEYTVLVNQARNLLNHECPELQNIKSASTKLGNPPPLWEFIAGGDRLNQKMITRYSNIIKKSIGRVHKRFDGCFSDELKKRAAKICAVQIERDMIEHRLQQALKRAEFAWYIPVFDQYAFGTFQRVLILCQIYPFEQFLNDNLSEIKIKHKRRGRSPSGKLPKRRVSWNKFHAALGKAPSQRSSGKKKGLAVNGSALCRSYLYLWGNVHIFRRSQKYKKTIYPFNQVINRYDASIKEAGELELLIAKALTENDELLELLKPILSAVNGGKTIIEHLEKLADRFKLKLTPDKVKTESKKVLGNWAKSRATDLVVKLLYKDLMKACKEHHQTM